MWPIQVLLHRCLLYEQPAGTRCPLSQTVNSAPHPHPTSTKRLSLQIRICPATAYRAMSTGAGDVSGRPAPGPSCVAPTSSSAISSAPLQLGKDNTGVIALVCSTSGELKVGLMGIRACRAASEPTCVQVASVHLLCICGQMDRQGLLR